jgi:hypothetical protein
MRAPTLRSRPAPRIVARRLSTGDLRFALSVEQSAARVDRALPGEWGARGWVRNLKGSRILGATYRILLQLVA